MAALTTAVSIDPALVAKMEKLASERCELDAQVRRLKKEEDSIKGEIKRAMGRLKRAPIGDTGRIIELVVVNKDGYTVQPYSYTLVNVVTPPAPQ